MFEIRHRIGINAPADQVYDALTTAEGGRSWWTEDTTLAGEPAVGGALTFTFGAPDRTVTMTLEKLEPTSKVVWRCTAGPGEWIDTTFTWDLRRDDDSGETVVLFTNEGWREPVEFMYHCTMKWGYYMQSLKHQLESGTGTPFPHDEKLSSWDV